MGIDTKENISTLVSLGKEFLLRTLVMMVFFSTVILNSIQQFYFIINIWKIHKSLTESVYIFPYSGFRVTCVTVLNVLKEEYLVLDNGILVNMWF